MEDEIKVLQVTRQFFPTVGGIQNMVLHLCQHLTSQGYKCDVLTLNRRFDTGEKLPAFERFEWGEIHRIPFIGSRRYPIAPRVLSYLSNYDVVHVHAIDFFVDYLALMSSFHRKPLVVSTHGAFFHTHWARKLKHIYFHTVTRLALRRFARVICDSLQDRRLFQEIVPVSKLQVIPNGIEFKRLVGLNRNPKPGKIISVGRIQKNKRIDRLLRVFAVVNQRLPYTTLKIIGVDWEGLLTELEDLTKELDIGGQVKFLGMVDDESLTRHLCDAQIWVSASEYESFGIALLEAMAVGVLPVVQSLDAFREFIVDGKNGFLTDFSDIAHATQTVCKAIQLDRVSTDGMMHRAQSKAGTYAWGNIIREFEKVYKDVLAGGQLD
jgi:alpha-1,3-mannosyltransferase